MIWTSSILLRGFPHLIVLLLSLYLYFIFSLVYLSLFIDLLCQLIEELSWNKIF